MFNLNIYFLILCFTLKTKFPNKLQLIINKVKIKVEIDVDGGYAWDDDFDDDYALDFGTYLCLFG